VLTFDLLAFAASVATGIFGALVGIGGGLIIVPLLSVLFGVDFHVAIATSLLGVIAVSSSASWHYLRDGLPDRRIGLLLLTATTVGGLSGGYIAGLLDARALAGIFGVVLVLVSVQMLRAHRRPIPQVVGEAGRFEFDWSYIEPTTGEEIDYRARRLWLGFLLSLVAGSLSGLLGIGGGAVNVPNMNVVMGIPMRVATTTSTFMIGATAVASSVLYLDRGQVDPQIVAPVVVGVVLGGLAGARLAHRVPQRALLLLFAFVAAFFSIQMLLKALG
jgi:uncharacterized membrane protein YfcA